MLLDLRLIKSDSYRNSLHNFDPVARCILRRKNGEHASCSAANACDLSVKNDAASIDIGKNPHRLAHSHFRELPLFIISADPHLIQRNNSHHRLPCFYPFSNLHCPLSNNPCDGRFDGATLQRHESVSHPTFHLLNERVSFYSCVFNLCRCSNVLMLCSNKI